MNNRCTDTITPGPCAAKRKKKRVAKVKEPCRWVMQDTHGDNWTTQGTYTKAQAMEFNSKPIRPAKANEHF